MNLTRHVPVLLNEVMDLLDVRSGGTYVDATLGGGGYTAKLLELSEPEGIVIAIDANKEALEKARGRFGSGSKKIEKSKPSLRSRSEPLSFGGGNGERLTLVEGNFRHITDYLIKINVTSVSGVVFDLGLSSDLLEGSGRGFSFKRDEPLLMSFSNAPTVTAATVLNKYSVPELSHVFAEYGEVRQAERIAQVIYERRKRKELERTGDLVGAVDNALGRHNPKVLAQVFQALRIEVNDELNALEEGLSNSLGVIESGGRIAVVSYHSLEDRIVKHFFSNMEKEKKCTVLTKKPILASAEEKKENPRSSSAKLRVAEKN